MSAALHQCQSLRDQLDTTVLAMHHPTKRDEDNERGGSGFRGGCADVLNIAEKNGVFILQSRNARDRGKDLKVQYVLDVVTLEGDQFRDEDGEQMTSCVPKVVGAATVMVRQQRQETETDKAVLGALADTPQSATKIRKTIKRQDAAVRESLSRLKGPKQDEGRDEGDLRFC